MKWIINISTFFMLLFFALEGTAQTTITWTGSTDNDFNTGTNWNPTGVPSATDSCVINVSSTTTITLSNSITVGALNMIISGNNNALILDVVTYLLTIEGNLHTKVSSGNSNTFVRLDCGASSGGVTVGRDCYFDDGGDKDAWVIADETNPGILTFKGDVTFGALAKTSPTLEPDIIFDGGNTQTVTVNNTSSYFLAADLVIGDVNSPTVVLEGGTVNGFGCYDGSVSVKGTSSLDLGPHTINRIQSVGGTFTIEAGATLKIGTTRTFPSNYSTYSLNTTSNTHYDGSNQTVAGNVDYGNIFFKGSGTKTLNAATTVKGDLTVETGVTFDVSVSNYALNLAGDWSNSGTFTERSGTVTLDGTAIQEMKGSVGTTFYDLTINNSNDVTVTKSATATNSVTFTDGLFITDEGTSKYLIFETGATVGGTPSASTHVNGPVQKLTNSITAFKFPIGDGTAYRPIQIKPTGTGATTWTAKYNNSGHGTTTVEAPLEEVSVVEYWDLDRASATADGTITLWWDSNSTVNTSDLTELNVAHFNGTKWEDAGSNSHTGNATAGSITSNAGWNSFSPFTIGAQVAAALPVTMTQFAINCQHESSTVLTWKTEIEINSNYFNIEKSIDGDTWEVVGTVQGQGNSDTTHNYTWLDHRPYKLGVSYYRLRQVDFNGESEIYGPLSSNCKTDELNKIIAYPNPTNGNVTIRYSWFNDDAKATLKLTDASSREILVQNVVLVHGLNYYELDMSDQRRGVYFVNVKVAGEKIKVTKVIKQ